MLDSGDQLVQEQSAGGGEALQLPATGDMPGSARVARRRFSFGEPLCSAAVTRQNSAPDLLRGGSVSQGVQADLASRGVKARFLEGGLAAWQGTQSKG